MRQTVLEIPPPGLPLTGEGRIAGEALFRHAHQRAPSPCQGEGWGGG